MRACLLMPTDLWQQPFMPGPYQRAMRQVEHLRRKGCEVSAVSWIRFPDSPIARLPAREQRQGVDVQRLVLAPPKEGLARRGLFFARLTREVAKAARGTGADAFIVHDPELLRAGLRASQGKPVFYDAHEHFPGMVAQHNPTEARLIDLLERRCAPRLAHVYTVSEGIAARFRAMGAPTTVLYNSKPLAQVERWLAPREQARQAHGIGPRDFVVGFPGSLAGEEGLELLLDALALAPPNVKLVAHGGPAQEAERLRALAAKKGLGARAFFLPPLPQEELFRKFSGFDAGALLLPDKGPNFEFRAPNKLFDYLALGLPVLTTPLQEPKRIVEETRCGLVVEREAKAIAGALERLSKEPGQRDRMGKAGQQAFRERYCWERMEERLRASHPFWR